MGVLVVAAMYALSIALPHWIIRFDEKRLSPIQYARAWNTASHWSAVVGFSWLSVLLHFAKTRRNFSGFALGLGCVLAGAGVQTAVISLLELLVDWLGG